jgi:hypothetical protein
MPTQNLHSEGCTGVPKFFVLENISEPYDNSFWEKSNPWRNKKEERESEKKKTPLIVDTALASRTDK